MGITLARFDAFHVPRIAQLLQRSNQFNLTTQRYGAAECEAMMGDEGCEPIYIRLRDRFGDSGLISVVILRYEPEVLAIDSWLMSCRVLARGVEDFAMDHVVNVARQRGYQEIKGVYLPTAKNAMVVNFYAQFGFRKVDEQPDGATTWLLRVDDYQSRPTFLNPVEGVTA
jgi:FkbH-like protein